MTETQIAPTKDIRDIPLDQLHISNGGLAVRHGVDSADDKALAANIAIVGLIQPLLVRPVATGGFAVVEGNRRLVALRAQKTPPTTACCIVDPKAGLFHGLSANEIRAALNPIDRCDGFSAMVRQGFTVPEVARAFSLKQREVEQSLALSGLAPAIKDKVRAGKLAEETAQALTLAKDHGTQERLLKQCGDNDHAIRAAIHKAHPLLGNALFDPKEYAVAGGTFVVDLFSDGEDVDQICADDAVFWKLQNAAIDEKVKALASQGWKIVLRQEGDLPPAYRHWPAPTQVKKSDRKFHTMRYTVDADGFYTELNYAEPAKGHKKKAEPASSAGAAQSQTPTQTTAPDAFAGEGVRPFSQGLAMRLAAHRGFQIKEAICANDSGLALRLLCWMLITRDGRNNQVMGAGSIAWAPVPIDGKETGDDAMNHYEAHETVYTGFAEFAEDNTAKLWDALAKCEEDELGSILIYVAAAAFDSRKPGSWDLGARILAEEPIPGRATFKPDKAFWESTSKGYMVAEIAKVLSDRLTVDARKALAAMKAPDLIALCAKWFTRPEHIDLTQLGLAEKLVPADLQQRFRAWVPHALELPPAPGGEADDTKTGTGTKETVKRKAAE